MDQVVLDFDIAIQGSSTSDKVLTFQFQNAVTQFDLSIGDWDGGGTGEVLSFGGISTASILSVGNDVGTAVYKDNGDNTITYATTNSSGGNEADGNGLRISLTNGGVAFNSFSISLDNAGSTGGSTDFIYVGGPTPVVPEPSSTALLGLGAIGLLVRRKR